MKTFKQIIVFTDSMGNCGINRVLSELTEIWIERGHHVSIAYMTKNNDLIEDDYNWDPRIKMIPIRVGDNQAKNYRILIKNYIKILKSNPEAIAVSLSVMTNFAMGAASLFVKNKIIISDRNDPTRRPAGRVKQAIRDLAFRQADVLILQTEDVQKYYESRIAKKGVIIPNPINNNLPLPRSADFKRKPVIVTSSRLNKQKNLGLLIEAFSKLKDSHPEYNLEIYGRGEEEGNLKNRAKECLVSDKVIFKGFSNNIYDDIKDCAIYVCSSDYEGISNALLEALGLGMPCISTDCPVGGSRLLIENGVNGILVDVGDAEALYQQMKRLIENPDLSRKLSENAVGVREKYNVEKIAQMWLDNM